MSEAKWIPLDEAVSIIKEFDGSWPNNFKFKYLGLRVDTRDNHCLMLDRDGNAVDPEDVRKAGIEWRQFLNREEKQ